MAISGFGRRKEDIGMGMPAAPAANANSAPSSGGALGNLTAFIDQGSEFEGKLSFKDTVRIDGCFSGEISSDNTLIVGETGEINATITSVCVVISGLVEGDITATDQVVLHKTAIVKGDIVAPSFVVEEGAQVNGTVRMDPRSMSTSSPSVTPINAKEPDDSKSESNKNDDSSS